MRATKQFLRETPTSSNMKPAVKYEYENFSGMFEVLQSLRKDKVFSDIKLVTKDGTIIYGHKVVLSSVSQYFYALFIKCAENNEDTAVIENLDSTTLQLLVDFLYSGNIVITEKNVQVLLPAANLLDLKELKEACCHFLQTQLQPTNCFSIKALANLHRCPKLLASSELYIQKFFVKVIEGDEFLSLSSEEIIKLISSEGLTVPYEEKVFECVIRWVKHELNTRERVLPQLMKHVRLPLTSKNYILTKVMEEPLLNKSLHYISEAVNCHLFEELQLTCKIPENIRTKPRLGDKIIFVIGGRGSGGFGYTEWYDPKIKRWQFGPQLINNCELKHSLAVLKNNTMFSIGGVNWSTSTVKMLDLFSKSPRWNSSVDMLVERQALGVGVINDHVYAVGGFDGTNTLSSAEVFDCSTQQWCMVTRMSIGRAELGIGVLNNFLYAVGGFNNDLSCQWLNSVEYYHPSLNKWTPVAKMSVCRSGLCVGVLGGVLYAVGGFDGCKALKSAEAYTPSTGVWTPIADMHFRRLHAGAVAFNGLLFVIGGCTSARTSYNSIEVYCPSTNSWHILGSSMNVPRSSAGVVVIDRPPNFENC